MMTIFFQDFKFFTITRDSNCPNFIYFITTTKSISYFSYRFALIPLINSANCNSRREKDYDSFALIPLINSANSLATGTLATGSFALIPLINSANCKVAILCKTPRFALIPLINSANYNSGSSYKKRAYQSCSCAGNSSEV